MSDQGLALAQQKMTDAGVAQQAIDVFSHYYRQLEEGVTGLYVPRVDPELIATKLMVLDADPDLRRRLGRQGRAHYEMRYSPAHFQVALTRALDAIEAAEASGARAPS